MKVLFICHGNICRSVMAEAIMKYKIEQLGIKNLECDSMAVSSEEIGNSIYPPAKEKLKEHNIPIIRHRARKFEAYDYDLYDYILCMDNYNIRLLNIIKKDTMNKYRLLLSFSKNEREISDPWYTRNFEEAYCDIDEGINSFIDYLKKKKRLKIKTEE